MDSSSQTETWGNTDRKTLTGIAVNGQIFTNRNIDRETLTGIAVNGQLLTNRNRVGTH